MKPNQFDSKRAQELYLELRHYRTKDGKFAFEYVYDKNKDELNANRINFVGFLNIMQVAHTFWTSRGEETKNDLENEKYEIINQ